MPDANPQFDESWLAPGTVSWEAVYALALASELAYRPVAEMNQTLTEDWGLSGAGFTNADTQGFLAHGRDVSILAVRGTQEPRDWITNLNFLPKRYDAAGGRVHAGFFNAWEDILPQVAEGFADLGSRKLWITGHSLGGAVAVMAGAAYHGRLSGLVTFGQPRVLRRRSARHMSGLLGGRYVRIVHDNDIVPKVPPHYSHTGQLSHFDDLGQQVRSGGPLEADGSVDSNAPVAATEEEFAEIKAMLAAAPVATEGDISGIPAHRMGAYVTLARRKAF